MIWPVTHPESSEARKAATVAISPGWPMRPSGVFFSISFWKSPADESRGVGSFRFDHARTQRIDANLLGAEFLCERAGDGVHRALGGTVYGASGETAAATELILMMLPPAGLKRATAAWVTAKGQAR